ncbi:hypothetical protein BYT27DRAFT_6383012 [Phlegmacium glaucopus]|nr:hypothetical protein BYT27DRAFT_6383012 [Phlegmacium glaucopus]
MWTPGPLFSQSSVYLLEEKYSRRSPAVTWLSPQENDMFGSWDTLTAKWNSQEVLDSPAFRLCKPRDDSLQTPFFPSQNETEEAYLDTDCGSTISPNVEESDGSFLIRFTVPDITEDAFFILQMNDAAGTVLSSPIFKFSSHPIHSGVHTRLPPRPNFTLETEPEGSPTTSRQHSPVAGFSIFLIVLCVLLTTAPLLWLYCHRGHVKMYFRRLRVSQTSTPALLQKIDPGDGTSVPIPVFMPQRSSRAPSQSARQLFLPSSLGRASGIHQPLHPGSSRSFRLPSRYLRGSTYPSLPPIPISSNTFIDEGDTVATNSALNNTHISCRPLLPPGLVSAPLGVHLRPSI